MSIQEGLEWNKGTLDVNDEIAFDKLSIVKDIVVDAIKGTGTITTEMCIKIEGDAWSPWIIFDWETQEEIWVYCTAVKIRFTLTGDASVTSTIIRYLEGQSILAYRIGLIGKMRDTLKSGDFGQGDMKKWSAFEMRDMEEIRRTVQDVFWQRFLTGGTVGDISGQAHGAGLDMWGKDLDTPRGDTSDDDYRQILLGAAQFKTGTPDSFTAWIKNMAQIEKGWGYQWYDYPKLGDATKYPFHTDFDGTLSLLEWWKSGWYLGSIFKSYLTGNPSTSGLILGLNELSIYEYMFRLRGFEAYPYEPTKIESYEVGEQTGTIEAGSPFLSCLYIHMIPVDVSGHPCTNRIGVSMPDFGFEYFPTFEVESGDEYKLPEDVLKTFYEPRNIQINYSEDDGENWTPLTENIGAIPQEEIDDTDIEKAADTSVIYTIEQYIANHIEPLSGTNNAQKSATATTMRESGCKVIYGDGLWNISSGTVTFERTFQGMNDVIALEAGDTGISHIVDSTGSVTVYVYTYDNTKARSLIINGTSGWCCLVYWHTDGQIWIFYGTYPTYGTYNMYPNGGWLKVRIDWDSSTHKQSVWIDDVLKISNQDFINTTSTANLMSFSHSSETTDIDGMTDPYAVDERTYVRFAMPTSVPVGSTILSAKLTLPLSNIDGSGTLQVNGIKGTVPAFVSLGEIAGLSYTTEYVGGITPIASTEVDVTDILQELADSGQLIADGGDNTGFRILCDVNQLDCDVDVITLTIVEYDMPNRSMWIRFPVNELLGLNIMSAILTLETTGRVGTTTVRVQAVEGECPDLDPIEEINGLTLTDEYADKTIDSDSEDMDVALVVQEAVDAGTDTYLGFRLQHQGTECYMEFVSATIEIVASLLQPGEFAYDYDTRIIYLSNPVISDGHAWGEEGDKLDLVYTAYGVKEEKWICIPIEKPATIGEIYEVETTEYPDGEYPAEEGGIEQGLNENDHLAIWHEELKCTREQLVTLLDKYRTVCTLYLIDYVGET